MSSLPTLLSAGWVSPHAVASTPPSAEGEGHGTPRGPFADLLIGFITHRLTRRARAEIARLDDRTLADMGLERVSFLAAIERERLRLGRRR